MAAKRIFDISLAIILILLFAIPMLFIVVVIKLTSPGPALYWSDRIGKYNKTFKMPKFRSMYINTPAVATHLLTDSKSYVTTVGKLLRKTSLDELPQLWSVLKGDMSFVGPRPALFNQYDLIAMRTQCGVHELAPGITGWAQINGRDELSSEEKTKFDLEYKNRQSFLFDGYIITKTFLKVVCREGVSH